MHSHRMQSSENASTLDIRLAGLIELGAVLSSEYDPQQLLERFCRVTQDVLDVRHVAVGIRSHGRKRRFAAVGLTNLEVGAIFDACEPRAGPLHASLVSGSPVTEFEAEAGPAGQSLGQSLHRRFLIAPILLRSQLSGWLYLSGKSGSFDEESKRLVALLVARLVSACERLLLHGDEPPQARQFELENAERKRVADKLREREAGLRRAQLMTQSAHVITGPDGSFESWSETLPQLLGVDDAGMPPTTRHWLDLLHPDDRARFREVCIDAGKKGVRMDVEYRLRRADGAWVHLRQVLEPLHHQVDLDGKMRWFNTIQDISEQKEQWRKIARLSRISAVLSGINSAIVRIHDRQELFQEACRVAVNLGELNMAWVGTIDPNTLGGRVISFSGGAPGETGKIRLTARGGMPESEHPACVAMREMRYVICNDIQAEPGLAPLKAELLERGHRSMVSLPLIVDNRPVGVISLFAREAGFFDEEEMKLLIELAGDLSFGLQYIEKEERLNYLAYYDALTGLPNRMLFQDRLTQLLHGARHDKDLAAVLMLDLHRFAELNDVLGRHAGDAVLREVGERLKAVLQESCILARLGGDTFGIAVTGLQHGTDAATVLMQQIFESLNRLFTVDDQDVRIAARAGIALYPEDGPDAETLFRHAEVALNRAKSSAEAYLYYAPQMNAAIAARMTLERELQVALDRRQFVVHFQPRVDLSNGRIVSAEALIRWQHPERGMVPPVDFIPLAEQTGLIIPIGAWVIDAVCAQQTAWLERHVEIVPVAVNLSTVQFKKGQVLQTIGSTIESYRLPRHYIEFELTESVVMNDLEEGSRNLQALKELGVKLSLDDFGTGYSSLAYLKRFPFDFVKIDRTFITDITQSPGDAAIAVAIIAMAHSLNLRVVAEGVETSGQLEFLRLQHCDELQGYYFSRPVPAEAFETMLLTGKRL